MNKRYFLGVLLPDETARRVRQWQERLDSKISRRPPPHITIGFNTFPCEKIGDLMLALDQLFCQVNPLDLRSVGVSTFPRQESVLYLKVETTEDLGILQEKVIKLLGGDRPVFTPHITIARLAGAALDKAIEYLTKQEVRFNFISSEVGLFEESLSDKPWQQIKTFQFRTGRSILD